MTLHIRDPQDPNRAACGAPDAKLAGSWKYADCNACREAEGLPPVRYVDCDGCGTEYRRGPHVDRSCGVPVCPECGHHQGLARCFCGWARSGRDGRRELEELGAQIEPGW